VRGPTAGSSGSHPANDIDGARWAGLTAVWLRGTHPWPTELTPPERHINDLAMLLERESSTDGALHRFRVFFRRFLRDFFFAGASFLR
jgi:hypothetical protein